MIEKKTTTEKSIGLETRDWIREAFSFTGYGKGVRLLEFKTTGNIPFIANIIPISISLI